MRAHFLRIPDKTQPCRHYFVAVCMPQASSESAAEHHMIHAQTQNNSQHLPEGLVVKQTQIMHSI